MRRGPRYRYQWVEVRRRVRLEPVDAHAVCVSGTVVLALLSLGVPLSEQAEATGIELHRLRATCAPGRCPRPLGVDVLHPLEAERLVALLSVAVADGEARIVASACAWGVGAGLGVSGYAWWVPDAS